MNTNVINSAPIVIFIIHYPDVLESVTAFGILMQATESSQKLWNHVLKISMQPGRTPYVEFTIIIWMSPIHSPPSIVYGFTHAWEASTRIRPESAYLAKNVL